MILGHGMPKLLERLIPYLWEGGFGSPASGFSQLGEDGTSNAWVPSSFHASDLIFPFDPPSAGLTLAALSVGPGPVNDPPLPSGGTNPTPNTGGVITGPINDPGSELGGVDTGSTIGPGTVNDPGLGGMEPEIGPGGVGPASVKDLGPLPEDTVTEPTTGGIDPVTVRDPGLITGGLGPGSVTGGVGPGPVNDPGTQLGGVDPGTTTGPGPTNDPGSSLGGMDPSSTSGGVGPPPTNDPRSGFGGMDPGRVTGDTVPPPVKDPSLLPGATDPGPDTGDFEPVTIKDPGLITGSPEPGSITEGIGPGATNDLGSLLPEGVGIATPEGVVYSLKDSASNLPEAGSDWLYNVLSQARLASQLQMPEPLQKDVPVLAIAAQPLLF